MAWLDDFTANLDTGAIRHASGTTVYSILDMHAALQDLADDAAGIDNDNPSELAGKRNDAIPMLLTLLDNGPNAVEFNIDDTAAQYLNFGSVSQKGGDEQYTGLITQGQIVAASPIFLVQNNSKVTKFWGNGHIQILVKCKTGGTLIDSGDLWVSSREYGQSFSDFLVNLAAGGEKSASVNTGLLDWVTLTEVQAAALSTKVTITVADSNHDLGNGNGSKAYKGTISLSNGCTVAEAAQYLHRICAEDSTTNVGSTPGWRFRVLDASYAPSAQSPFGYVAGGKFFVAQGWWLEGVIGSEAKSYQLIAHDGTTQAPPNVVGISVGNLVAGDRVIVGRTTTVNGPFDKEEYTLAAGHTTNSTSIVVKESIKTDTPQTGEVRVSGNQHAYSAWSGSTFTLVGTLGQIYSENTYAWVPLMDLIADETTESVTLTFSATIEAAIDVRNNECEPPIKPYRNRLVVTDTGASQNVIRTPDA